MRATGFVRRVDALGRIVIPKDLRVLHGLTPGAMIEIYCEGEQIVICRHRNACVLCDGTEDLRECRDRALCGKCVGRTINTVNLI